MIEFFSYRDPTSRVLHFPGESTYPDHERCGTVKSFEPTVGAVSYAMLGISTGSDQNGSRESSSVNVATQCLMMRV